MGLRDALYTAIDRNVNQFNPQNIANTLLAISQMGVTWDALPSQRLRDALYTAINRNVTQFNPQAIANTLLAMNQMGVTWDALPSQKLRDALYIAIDRNVNQFNSQAIANTLLAINQMGVTWESLPSQQLRDALYTAIDRNVNQFIPQAISITLLAINQMGVTWDALPSQQLRDALYTAIYRNVNQFNPQEIANTLLAINQMKVNQNLDFEILWSSADKNFNRFIPIEKHELALALTCWTAFRNEAFSNELNNSVVNLISKFKNYNSLVCHDVTKSQLQSDVFQCIKQLIGGQTNVKHEYQVGVANCISVDIYVPPSSTFLQNKSNTNGYTDIRKGIIVEVNGPSHFQQSPGVNESNRYSLNVKTVKKQELLEKMGYLYVDIPYYEWDKIGNDKKKKKLYLKGKLEMVVKNISEN